MADATTTPSGAEGGASAQTASTAPPATPDAVTALAARKIRARFPDAVVEVVEGGRHPFVRVEARRLADVAALVRDDPDLAMDCCHLISGVDWPSKTPAGGPGADGGPGSMEVVYHLVSYARKPDAVTRRSALKNDGFLVLKVRVPRDKPEVPSVMGVWIGADWHERETWDLCGIRFTGRPDLRRILLPEDWPGHPLRKDWQYPAEYHSIPIIPPEGR